MRVDTMLPPRLSWRSSDRIQGVSSYHTALHILNDQERGGQATIRLVLRAGGLGTAGPVNQGCLPDSPSQKRRHLRPGTAAVSQTLSLSSRMKGNPLQHQGSLGGGGDGDQHPSALRGSCLAPSLWRGPLAVSQEPSLCTPSLPRLPAEPRPA